MKRLLPVILVAALLLCSLSGFGAYRGLVVPYLASFGKATANSISLLITKTPVAALPDTDIPVSKVATPFRTILAPIATFTAEAIIPVTAPTLPVNKPYPSQIPTATPVPLQPPSPQSPQLQLTVKSNCRGGPGGPESGYDLIWTFFSGVTLDIVGSDGDWWLVQFSNSGTHHDKCWIYSNNGVAVGDLASVPFSDYRTVK
jgi:hypothetical protein